jgi:hypothetical protein
MTETTMLTVKDLVGHFNVSPHTVLGWIASGQLPAVNVGVSPGKRKPRWRVTSTAVAEFEATRMTMKAPPRAKRKTKDPEIVEFYP